MDKFNKPNPIFTSYGHPLALNTALSGASENSYLSIKNLYLYSNQNPDLFTTGDISHHKFHMY